MTRLLLIGAAGVDWAGLAARREALPHLAALSGRGVKSWLNAAPPRQGPAAWAGVATGQLPETHRVIRPDEAWAGGRRPLTLASWAAPPVWSRLAAAGVETASVAWPGARPGAAAAGLHIDEDFAEPTGPDGERWALPLRCAPDDVREALRDARTHPRDISAAMLAPLVPGIAGIDQARDTGLPRIAVAMARAATVQTAATWLLEARSPDALFVHFGWLGEVRDAFDDVNDGAFAGVVDAAWRFLDALVGRLAALAGPEALVMVVSPGRRSNPGALIAAGGGLPADGRLARADVRDVAPTALAHFGLEDPALSGRPLAGVGGPSPRRTLPPAERPAPVQADAALLSAAVAAGYAAPAPLPAAWRAQHLAELAAAVVERDPRTACVLADEALAQDAEHVLALGIKTMGHVALEEAAPLAGLGDTLLRVAPDRGWGALAHAVRYLLSDTPDAAVPWLIRAEVDKRPEMQLRIATTWVAAGRPGQAARLFRAVIRATPQDASAHIGLAVAAAANRNFREAETALVEASRLDPSRPAAHLQLAHVYALTGRTEEARRAAARAAALGAIESQVAAAQEGRLAE